MKIALVTDAWQPQVNGVVVTLVELARHLRGLGHEVVLIEPSAFRRFPCPGYREIELAWRPRAAVARLLDEIAADAVHIATEGPLGCAARRHCLARGWAFTTAFHTRFPDILAAALRLPATWAWAWFRGFHRPSSGVMVPTEGMQAVLAQRGFVNLRAWSHGVDLDLFGPVPDAELGLPRPIWLYVGRVSYEKNLPAFLELPLPGSKVVYGIGPVLAQLQRRHPGVHWGGVLPRSQLARLYSAADVFVFPSRNDTFGLVMLEALACGTPVAAFPVPGPSDVIGGSPAGVLDEDLFAACSRALNVPRQAALDRAAHFGWAPVTEKFLSHLVPARPATALPRSSCHVAVSKAS